MASPPDDELRLDAELRGAAQALRGVTAADRVLESPPESIWAAIESATAATDASGGDETEPAVPASEGADVVDLSWRGRNRRGAALRWVGLAAAAVIALIVGIGVVLTIGDEATQEVVARADLARLDDDEVIGEADLVERDDALRLEVDLPGDVDPGDGFFELWLINDDVTELISLGPLPPGNSVTATLPDTIDPASFPIVDVSYEPLDGDTTHSGNSLVRGRLSV